MKDDWNYDLSQAPRGGYVEKTLTGRNGSVRTVREWASPRVIIASRCGKVITSRWLPPDERKKGSLGRWEFFCEDSDPLAWRPYPKHPMETGDGT